MSVILLNKPRCAAVARVAASLFFALACNFASTLNAQHDDIEIAVEGGVLVVENRIAEGEFGEAPNDPNVGDEPGFEADDGVMVPGTTLEFNAVDLLGKNLWYWDGASDVAFGDSPHNLTLQHPVTGAMTMLSSTADGGATGFLIGAADGEGGVHQDIEFVLDTNPPMDGVYLFGLELTSDSYGSSEPVYFVLASGVDEAAHEAAIDWTSDAFSIPEPSGLTILALGLVMGFRRVFS